MSLDLFTLRSASPLITLRVIVRAGSAYDPAGKEGLAALTAQTINEGGNRSLTHSEILQQLYPMAAVMRAQADKELITFIGEVHKDHLERYYQIFSENLLQPRFDAAEFERLRKDQINYLEKTLRGANDEELGKQALELEIYRDHPYGHAVTGSVRGLKSITLDDVKSFYREHYQREAIRIGVAGDLSDQFLEKIGNSFASLSNDRAPALPLPAPARPQGLEITIIEKETRATAISLGAPIEVTRRQEDFYPLLVANSYLGEHRTFNGQLMINMRVKRGLNYGDYSYIEHFVQEGESTFPLPNNARQQQYFSIWVRPVPNENRLFALRQAIRELELLVTRGIPESEFQSTRKFLLNYCNLWVQTLSRRLGYRLDSHFYGCDDFISEIQRRLPKLSAADVNGAVRRYLDPHSLKAVIVTHEAAALRARLLANAPSPITYESDTPAEVLAEDKLIENYRLSVNPDRLRIVPVAQVFEH